MSDRPVHVTIGGPNKAGTTSLFRYLAAHPEVCAARIKETNFFREPLQGSILEERDRYQKLFTGATTDTRVYLDASPGYLKAGEDIAERIHRHLPDARLIFVLREPASRLLSYFRFNQQNLYNEKVAALDLADYVSLVERASVATEWPDPGPARNAMMEFQRGCYANSLEAFFDRFPESRMHITFFDDLVSDPRGFSQDTATFLGIDPGFYDDFSFVIENRTREFRWKWMQKLVQRGNTALEPLLNRFPSLRRGLRSAYALVNEQRGATAKGPRPDMGSLVKRLRNVYLPHNMVLHAVLMQRYPGMHFPAWLAPVAADREMLSHRQQPPRES